MNKICRMTCIFLSVIIMLSVAFDTTFGVSAAASRAYINGTNVRIRSESALNSATLDDSTILCTVSNVYVTVNGEKKGANGYTWYNVTYNGITGYIRNADYVILIDSSVDKTFEEQLAAFPESYRSYLRDLHAIYPNWKFYADNINMTLDKAVSLELVRKVTDLKSLSWRSMDLGSYDWGTGKWVSLENGRWHYVSREVIKYYMDPRNFLNASYICTFMLQNNNSSAENEEALKKVVKGTFLESGYYDPNDTAYGGSYINVLIEAAKSSGVNPCILASGIIQEQGRTGSTKIISGTYSGYEGYYNFFNIGANGENPTLNGLVRAKNEGWNARSKSIIEGAKFWREKYIDKGQNTYFYMNYNIKNTDKLWHQYATAVHDSASKGYNVSMAYAELKSAELDFYIPVYSDMPSTVSPLPDKTENLNNYYFNSISVEGLTNSFNRFTYNYNLHVSDDKIVSVSVPGGASYVGVPYFYLNPGENRVALTVKAQTGYTNDYIIDVLADKACVLYVDSGAGITPIGPNPDPTPPPQIMRGDTNGDGKINGRDAANVQMHILEVKLLTGNAFSGGDTNKDGIINGRDAANIQMDILGIKPLTQ